MRNAAVLVLAAMVGVVSAGCERQADVPPGQPTEGVAPGDQPQPAEPGVAPDAAEVELFSGDGTPVGSARLTHREDGVEVLVRLLGLTPGQEHGFHVHERGECTGPGFESAGAHFSPEPRQHGFLNPQGPHAGDLPNLRANAEGIADTTFTTTHVRLRAGASQSLEREAGVALVVHQGADDYRTDPSGNSGARIACGVVRWP